MDTSELKSFRKVQRKRSLHYAAIVISVSTIPIYSSLHYCLLPLIVFFDTVFDLLMTYIVVTYRGSRWVRCSRRAQQLLPVASTFPQCRGDISPTTCSRCVHSHDGQVSSKSVALRSPAVVNHLELGLCEIAVLGFGSVFKYYILHSVRMSTFSSVSQKCVSVVILRWFL